MQHTVIWVMNRVLPGEGSDYVNFVSQYLLEESHQVEMIRLGTYNKKDK